MGYSNGFLRKSASGKFVGVLKYKDPTGQWRQVTKTFTRDEGASKRMLAEWRGQMASGEAARGGAAYPPGGPDIPGGMTFASPSPTVEESVRSCLATQLARGHIERSTYNTQLSYAERCTFPELGGIPIARLRPADVQTWVDRMCLDISPGSARIPYSTLRKACMRAMRNGDLGHNPFTMVEPPTRTRPSRAYLPPTSIALLERAVAESWGPAHPFACAVALALHAGLRAGECCGLRWRDVDVTANRLRVASSIGRSAEGCYVKGPKSASSAREFPIVAPLARIVVARRDVVAGAGKMPNASWFVCGEGGAFSDPRALSTAFAQLCGEAGVTDDQGRRATFHTLRHTFATRAVRAGVDVRTLADLLGHARADVTLNVYAGSCEDAKLAAIAKMESFA